MANSTQVRTGLQSLIQTHVSDRLKSTLFNRMPLFYFLFARDGQKTGPDGIGIPKTSMFLSGVETAKARREEILSSRVYEPIVQTTAPAASDGKVLSMYDTMPNRSSWTTATPSSYFTRPRVKWVERADPYKVPNKEIRTTRSAGKNEIAAWKAVGSLFQAETTSVIAKHTEWWNQSIWGTTGSGAPSNEDNTVWDAIHSIQNALHDSNTYCGVDRSVGANSYWRSNRTTAATVADFETIINQCNYDFGLSKKGTGVDLILVDGTNFKKAKSEAKAKGHTLIKSGDAIPNMGRFGFSRELVQIDNTYIVYDPECPSGHVAALNLATWTMAIHPDANFKVSEPFDQTKVQGDDATTGQIRTEAMLVCEVPSLNAYYTNVA